MHFVHHSVAHGVYDKPQVFAIVIRAQKLYSTDDEDLRHAQIMPDGEKYRGSNYYFIFPPTTGNRPIFIFIFSPRTMGKNNLSELVIRRI